MENIKDNKVMEVNNANSVIKREDKPFEHNLGVQVQRAKELSNDLKSFDSSNLDFVSHSLQEHSLLSFYGLKDARKALSLGSLTQEQIDYVNHTLLRALYLHLSEVSFSNLPDSHNPDAFSYVQIKRLAWLLQDKGFSCSLHENPCSASENTIYVTINLQDFYKDVDKESGIRN